MGLSPSFERFLRMDAADERRQTGGTSSARMMRFRLPPLCMNFHKLPGAERSSAVLLLQLLQNSPPSALIRIHNKRRKQNRSQATDGAPKCFCSTNAIVPRSLGWDVGSAGTIRVPARVNECRLTASVITSPT